MLLCDGCFAAFRRIKAAPGESHMEHTYRLADWAIRRAVRLERARVRKKALRTEAAPATNVTEKEGCAF